MAFANQTFNVAVRINAMFPMAAFAGFFATVKRANTAVNGLNKSLSNTKILLQAGFAILGIDFLKNVTNSAMQFQQAMNQIRLSASLTAAQTQKLGDNILKMSGQYPFQPVEMAHGLQPFMQRFPTASNADINAILQAATVARYNQFDSNLSEAVGDLTGLAYDLGAKTSSQVAAKMPEIVQAALMAPGGAQSVMHMLRYGAAAKTAFGLTDSQALAWSVRAAYMTGGGMWAGFFSPESLARASSEMQGLLKAGGVNLNRNQIFTSMLLGLDPNSIAKSGMINAQGGLNIAAMGKFFEGMKGRLSTAQGQIAWLSAIPGIDRATGATPKATAQMQGIVDYYIRSIRAHGAMSIPQLLGPQLSAALGPSGAELALAFMSGDLTGKGRTSFAALSGEIAKAGPKGLANQYQTTQQLLVVQLADLSANLKALTTALGTPALSGLTKGVEQLNSFLVWLKNMVVGHPAVGMGIDATVAGGTALLGGAAINNIIKRILGKSVTGLMGGLVGGIVRGLGGMIMGAGATDAAILIGGASGLGAIAAIIAGLYLVVTHWKQISSFITQHWTIVQSIVGRFVTGFVEIGFVVNLVKLVVDNWHNIITTIDTGLKILGNIFSSASKNIFNFFKGTPFDMSKDPQTGKEISDNIKHVGDVVRSTFGPVPISNKNQRGRGGFVVNNHVTVNAGGVTDHKELANTIANAMTQKMRTALISATSPGGVYESHFLTGGMDS